MVTMMPATERARTKLFLYAAGFCNYGMTFHLYNSYHKVFVGRQVAGERLTFATATLTFNGENEVTGVSPAGVATTWDFKTDMVYTRFGHLGLTSFATHHLGNSDADGDGSDAIRCGGDDCDDHDPRRYPGNIEVCDPLGHDEDCDLTTFGNRDVDGDTFTDPKCFNIDPVTGLITSQGTDCDDTNARIVPGAVRYISETEVEICGIGIYSVGSGNRAVYQPDGTAIVIPK